MNTLTNDPDSVQHQAANLRDEIQRWVELVRQLEDRASQTKDATSLGVMEGFLRSARQTIEQVTKLEPTEVGKQYPFMPMIESQEITLPANLRPAGTGVPVKSRKGGERLPDPASFPQE